MVQLALAAAAAESPVEAARLTKRTYEQLSG